MEIKHRDGAGMILKIAAKTTLYFLVLMGVVLLVDFIASMNGWLFAGAIAAVISGWLLLYQIVAGIELRRPLVRPSVVSVKKSRPKKNHELPAVHIQVESLSAPVRPVPHTPQIATATQPPIETPSMHAIAPAPPTGGGPVKADAISVLCNLGYTKSDARRSVAMVQIENPYAELDELVRTALALLVSPLVVNQSAAVN